MIADKMKHNNQLMIDKNELVWTTRMLAGTQIWRGSRTPVEMEGWGIPLSPRC